MSRLLPLLFCVAFFRAKQFVKQSYRPGDIGIGERIKDGLRFSPRCDEFVFAQTGKMLRKRGLSEAQRLLQRGNTRLTLMQFAQNHQTVAVSQSLQKVFGLHGFWSELH